MIVPVLVVHSRQDGCRRLRCPADQRIVYDTFAVAASLSMPRCAQKPDVQKRQAARVHQQVGSGGAGTLAEDPSHRISRQDKLTVMQIDIKIRIVRKKTGCHNGSFFRTELQGRPKTSA